MKADYRPDIDGLRAVAVLSVLLYHADFGGLRGGFVGVDVFFVISGFLITRLLVAELETSGRIRFGEFFLRRSRRLLPALFAVLLATTLAAVWLSSAAHLKAFGGSLAAAALSVANVYFYFEIDYFSTDSALKPLLHTWSLGVEEQFYLIWPLLLAWCGVTRRGRIGLVLVLGVLSAAAGQYLLTSHSSAVFYLLPFRMVELLLGAGLALYGRTPVVRRWWHEALFLLGLLVILITVTHYEKRMLFPGLAALIPCMGAVLCIHAGGVARSAAFLRSRLMVGVGLISYSLYLVHWPLIALYKQSNLVAKLTRAEGAILVGASFVLAYALYRGVERPWRYRRDSARVWVGFVLFAMVGFSAVGLGLRYSDGWPGRGWIDETLDVRTIAQAREARFIPRQEICGQKGWETCDVALPDRINGLVIGDSHAVDAYNALRKVAPAHDLSLSEMGGCAPLRDAVGTLGASFPDVGRCAELNRTQRFNPDFLQRYDYIVLSILMTDPRMAELTLEYLGYLQSIGIRRVVVVGGYLTLDREFPELVNRYGLASASLQSHVVPLAFDDAALRQHVEALGYFYVSKLDAFCRGPQIPADCQLFDGTGTLFTYDQHHLSRPFAERILDIERARLLDYLARS